MQSNGRKLVYGVHFGASELRQELPGFSLSLLAPTLRAEDVPLHTHDNATFVLVLSGSYLSTADGAPPVCSEPALIFNPAGTTHRDSFVLPAGRFLALSISDETLRIAGDSLPVVAKASLTGSGVAAAMRIFQQCIVPRIDSPATMESLCWELVSSAAGTILWPNEKHSSVPGWIVKAHELLHDQCGGPLPITEMARELGVHPVYFARAFRRVFRCTPAEYRMRCRLGKGMALLRNPRLPLSEISLRAGFYDQSHFSTAFREHFGISPQAYRRNLCEVALSPRGSIYPRCRGVI